MLGFDAAREDSPIRNWDSRGASSANETVLGGNGKDRKWVSRAYQLQITSREADFGTRVEQGRERERRGRELATGRNEDLSLPAANSREIPWQSRRAKRVSNEIDSRDLPRTYDFVQLPNISYFAEE